MERSVWTDDRLDDSFKRIDQRFDAVDRRFDRLEDRMDRGFDRVWSELREMRGQMAASSRQLAQIGWALVGILFVQLVAAIIAFS